jgi:putative ABC transport system permease protein
MFKNYIKIAVRNLMNSRLFTLLNVIGLAGGMAAAVLILMWVSNEFSFDTFHKKSSRTALVITHNRITETETWHWAATPLPFAAQAKTLPEIEEVTRLVNPYYNGLPIRVNNELINQKKAICVDSNWFQVFDYQFVDGGAKDFTSHLRSIAMSKSKAIQLFGESKVTGKTIRIDSLDYTVKAVYEDNPANSSFQYDIMVPLAAHLANPEIYKGDNNWNNFNYQTYIVYKEGTDLKKLSNKLTRLIQLAKVDEDGKPAKEITLEVEQLADTHFDGIEKESGTDMGDLQTTYVFLGLALVILLVACINYVNLTTARASIRAKEVTVKKLIGAENSHLFKQFMTESVITCLVAFGVSLILMFLLLPTFNEITGKTFHLNPLSFQVWPVLLGTSVAAILLTGIYPSLLLSSFKPSNMLKGSRGALSAGNSYFRKTLVIGQFTVSVVFLIITIIVYQQMKFIQNAKLGYDKSHVFEFQIPWNLKPKVESATIKERLKAESSIADVTTSNGNIVNINSAHSGSLHWDGQPKDFQPTVGQLSVEPNYMKMFGLKMKEGRWFQEGNTSDLNNVVLNEAAVKKLGLKKPYTGQRFEFQSRKGVVIGVVKDFHYKSLRQKIDPLVIFEAPDWRRGVYVKAVPGQEAAAIKAAEKVWAELVPSRPMEYKFLDESFDALYKSEKRTSSLLNSFSIIAAFISCLGLFGLATFSAERRTKEIGIRKVLGSSVAGIVQLLSVDFLKLVLISILIASPLAYYFADMWLKDFSYKITIQWWVFVAGGALALLIALVTISFQSIKAALMNPVTSLKSE